MLDTKSITGRHIGLFLFGCFLFCYPVLTIFNLPLRLFGIPLLFLYLFIAWSVLIVFIVFCAKFPDSVHPPEPEAEENRLTPPGLT